MQIGTSVFSGCSFTEGAGWPGQKTDPNLWVNLLHSSNDHLKTTKILNVAESGSSNQVIFANAVSAVSSIPDVKYLFVVWSSFPRYQLNLGIELYDTSLFVGPSAKYRDYPLHNIKYTKQNLQTVCNKFLALEHDHSQILQLITLSNILINLSKKLHFKIFFVNGLCPWDENFFVKKTNVLPSSYTEYTKKLLSTETRSDNESFALYDKIHSEYLSVGGVQENFWLNLYNSLLNLQSDCNSDHQHPGIKSNLAYAKLLSKAVNKHLTDTV